MSRVRTLRTRKAPEGFDKIEPVLLELEQKMKDAVNESHELKRRNQAQWPIFRIEHQQNRYIYELYYKKKVISRELYDWLVEQNYVNVQLVGKWRKAGYERLCCLKCIQPKDTNYGTTCICRVPSNQLHAKGAIECSHCGCRGCASGDAGMEKAGPGPKKAAEAPVNNGSVGRFPGSPREAPKKGPLFSAAAVRESGGKRTREEMECPPVDEDDDDVFKLADD